MERPSSHRGIWVVGIVSAVIALALVFVNWSSGDELALPGDVRAALRSQPNKFGGIEPAGSAGVYRVAREPVPDEHARRRQPPAASGSALPTWAMHLRVVDERYQPVVGAKVSVTLGRRLSIDQFDIIGKEPLEFLTDGGGRLVQSVKAHFASVTVTAEGFDNDAVAMLRAEQPDDEVILLLTRPVTLRGIVRDSLGQPVVGAKVAVWESRPGSHRQLRETASDQSVSGADGSFELPVQLGSGHSLRAIVGDEKSFPLEVAISSRDPDPVELVMPGGIVVSGMVRAPDGSPAIDGAVYAWREGHPEERLKANTFSGKFTLQLPAFEPFFVSGYGYGFASGKPVVVTPTREQPHVKVTLELQKLAYVRGRVVNAAGEPQQNVAINAWLDGLQPRRMEDRPSRSARFRDVRNVWSAKDGTFEFGVHPDAVWTVEARATGEGDVKAYGVHVGDDLELVLDGPLCPVRGRVTRADGRPIGACRAGVWQLVGGVASGAAIRSVEPDGRGYFDLPPQPAGIDVVVRVVPEDRLLGPLIVGPVRTGGDPIELEFLLQASGELPVEVVDHKGSPVPFAHVRWRQPHLIPIRSTGYTDADGRTLVRGCATGRGTLEVSLWGRLVATQETEVGPGPNRTLFLQLKPR